MATGNISLPADLLPKLEEIARTENLTSSELARRVLERYVVRRQAAAELEKLSAWGQQHSKRMGYKQSDVQPAIADFRRKHTGP